tara:strand:+ start:5760 stop:9275 length:3516 start_codon:yes stop_codon:yes gene_type:complete
MATPNVVPRAAGEGGIGTLPKGWGGAFITNTTTSSATEGGKIVLSANDGAVMASGHRLGVIEFRGAEDTSNTLTVGARIEALCDSTWSATENGADLLFYTTDGNASESEHMRILATGNVGIGVADPDTKLEIFSTTTQLKLSHNANDYATFTVADTGDLTIATVGDGTTDSDMTLDPDGALIVTPGSFAGTVVHIDADAHTSNIVDIDAGSLDIDVLNDVTIDANDLIALTTADTGADGKISLISGVASDNVAIHLDGNADVASIVDIDAGVLDIDASKDINIDAEDNISISASDDVTVRTSSADGLLTLFSAHTAGQAIHIDGNANAGSIVDIDAGILDIDVDATATIDATTSLTITTPELVLSGASTVFSSSLANEPVVEIRNEHNGSSSGKLKFNNTEAGTDGSDSDYLGIIDFAGNDDGTPSAQTYASINSRIHDASSGTECGRLNFQIATNTGSLVEALHIKGTTSSAQPTMEINADVDVDGTFTMDGAGFSLDSAGTASNITVASDGAADDLTISLTGATDSSILITSSGTGADAVSIDATAGGFQLAPSLADDVTAQFGPTASTFLKLRPSDTASAEKIVLTNVSGTSSNAIDINATAGSIDIDAGDNITIDAADSITIATADTGADGKITIASASTGSVTGFHLDVNADSDVITDIDAGTLDIDASGDITIDSSNDLTISVINDTTIATRDVLSLQTTSADGHILIGSAHTSGTALHIDANADAGSIVDIDAGILDVDVTGVATITAASSNYDSTGTTAYTALLHDFNTSATTTNAIQVRADSVTSGHVIDIECDGLTTGSALYIQDLTYERGLHVHIDVTDTHTSTINRGTSGLLVIDYERPATHPVASSQTVSTVGQRIRMDDNATNVGTSSQTGLHVYVDNASANGTTTNYGLYTRVGGADNNYSITMENNGNNTEFGHIHMGDELTISTESDDGTGHLFLKPDGEISLDPIGGTTSFSDNGSGVWHTKLSSGSPIIQVSSDGRPLIFNQYDGAQVAEIMDGTNLPTASGTSTSIASANIGTGGFGFRKMVLNLGSGNDDNTLALTDRHSGCIVAVTPTNNVQVNLPAAKPGLEYKFVVVEKHNKVFKIATATQDGADNFLMRCQTLADDGATFDGGGDTLSITNAEKGTYINLTCIAGGAAEIWLAEVFSTDSTAMTNA